MNIPSDARHWEYQIFSGVVFACRCCLAVACVLREALRVCCRGRVCFFRVRVAGAGARDVDDRTFRRSAFLKKQPTPKNPSINSLTRAVQHLHRADPTRKHACAR